MLQRLLKLLGWTTKAEAPAALVSQGAQGAPLSMARSPLRGARSAVDAYCANPELRKVVWRVAQATAQERWEVKRRGQVDTAHELVGILRTPVYQDELVIDGVSWRELLQVYLDLIGEAYIVIAESSRPGRRVDLYIVPPQDVTREPWGARVRLGARMINAEHSRLVWIKHLDPRDPYGRGHGLAQTLSDEVELAEACAVYTGAYFRNGARPDMIVSIERADQATLERSKLAWDQRYQGAAHSHQTVFLSDVAKVHPVTQSLDQAGMRTIRDMAADSIRELYGVPPEIFGQLESSNRATAQESRKLFADYVLAPRLELIKRAFESQLLPKLAALGLDTRDLELVYSDPSPDDVATRLEILRLAPGAVTVNEARAIAGLKPRRDGDVYMRPADMAYAPAQPILDMTESAQLIEPPPLPARRILRLVKSAPEQTPPVESSRRLRIVQASKQASPDELADEAIQALQAEALYDGTRLVVARSVETWALKEAAQGGYTIPASVWQQAAERHLSDYSLTTQQMTDTTRERARAALVEGLQRGESMTQIADRLRGSSAFNAARAELIARTEVMRAANMGRYASIRHGGAEFVQWIATVDGRTRPTHRALHRQVRPIDTEFSAGGHTALAPGGFSTAAQNARCRCTIGAYLSDEVEATSERAAELDQIGRSFDEELRPLETEMEAALATVFEAQVSAVIAALSAIAPQEAA